MTYLLLTNQNRRCPWCGSSRLVTTQGSTDVPKLYREDAEFCCCGCGSVIEIQDMECSPVAPRRSKATSRQTRKRQPPTRYQIQCHECGVVFNAILSDQHAARCPGCGRQHRRAA